MKNKYEYLANIFQENLGDNYTLVFDNDESVKWEEILIDNIISGVMKVNSGSYEEVNGFSVSSQQLSIQFMIPTKPEVFSVAIQTIEDTFKKLNNQSFEFDSEIIKVLFNYVTDSNRVVINGTDYASMYVYLNLFSMRNALMSNETTITIDNQQLKGVFHATYSNNHTADAKVRGYSTLIQTNSVNAIQQALSVDLVVVKGDELIVDIMQNANSNKRYSVVYDNGLVTRSFSGYVVNLSEDGTFNDTLKVKIVFGVIA